MGEADLQAYIEESISSWPLGPEAGADTLVVCRGEFTLAVVTTVWIRVLLATTSSILIKVAV